MGFRFLGLIKPVMGLLPDVIQPDRKIPFKEKILWTVISLFVFLVCSQVGFFDFFGTFCWAGELLFFEETNV